MLQRAANAVSVPLQKIFKLSLSTGECPSVWRSTNDSPDHKKGDRTDPSNYRPVSLTRKICEVLESLVHKHIVKHILKFILANNIVSDKQYGFRKRRSCSNNFLEVTEFWSDSVDVAF